MRNFITGIYSYSTMTSVFTEIDFKKIQLPMKMTTSRQDWCGQSFIQFNKYKKKYLIRLFSYFGKEADRQTKVKTAYLEDGIFNQIRLNPNLLPLGKIKIIPGSIYLRFQKKAIEKPYNAKATLLTDLPDKKLKFSETTLTYQIIYQKLNRIVKIYYSKKFPYKILAWSEQTKDNSEPATKAKLKTSNFMPYWHLNKSSDEKTRSLIGF